MVILTGFGNPLLDITVHIQDDSLLQKFKLQEDGQSEIEEAGMKQLLEDISKEELLNSPGGCVQNTLRILQWILDKPESTAMFGSIGTDKQGETLKDLVQAAGVKTRYLENKEAPTGTTVALVKDANRTLVAYLGAAEIIPEDHVKSADFVSMLKQTGYIYMEAFFLPKRTEIARFIQKFSIDNLKVFIFNLSAVYMSESLPEDMIFFAKKCDILFGNKREFTALAKAMKSEESLDDLLQTLLKEYSGNGDGLHGKMIVMTNGSETVTCVHGSGGTVVECPVAKVEKIGDTTGAGDAFVAGFLAGLFKNQSPTVCLKWGCWVAAQIIQQVGCTVPDYPTDDLNTIS